MCCPQLRLNVWTLHCLPDGGVRFRNSFGRMFLSKQSLSDGRAPSIVV
jgi:hypothetical protein